MKRLLSLILVLLMVFSMTACGHNMDKNQKEPTKEPNDGQNVTISQTEAPVTESVETEPVETKPVETEAPIPEFTYAMAKLHENVTEDYTELWFVLECLHHDFGLVIDDEFLVINFLTGDDISDLGTRRDTDYKYEVYTGNVCVNDHAGNPNRFQWGHSDDDARQYVVKICSANPIGFDDLKITANPYYNGGIGVDTLDPVEVGFNAEMSDITTQQDYIHGTTLFKLDGKYYISDDGSGIGGEFYDYGTGIVVDFIYITGTAKDLAASFKNNVTYVYDNLQGERYLSEVPTPDGAVIGLSIMETSWRTSIRFGYKTDGVTDVDEDAIEDIAFDITPVYHFEDGHTMTFLFI